jgi:osmotically-inducible protein OsmY
MRKTLLNTLCIFLFSGFFTAQQTAQTTKQTFTFDYTPTQSTKSGSVPMVVALLKPYYAPTFQNGSNELFSNFRQALGGDIEELIIAKGFTIKGSYQAFDEMVYEAKQRTDMAIQIEINPRFTAGEGNWKANYHVNLTGASYNTYTYDGKVSLIGKINLSGFEPLTHEKIWSKSVSTPNVENISIQTTGTYTRQLQDFELYKDPGVYNAIGKALGTQYQGIMEKIAAHFNAEEFMTLKSQIKELKSKKGF